MADRYRVSKTACINGLGGSAAQMLNAWHHLQAFDKESARLAGDLLWYPEKSERNWGPKPSPEKSEKWTPDPDGPAIIAARHNMKNV